jgi:lipopolysaccharide transport system ATP-binding protein
MSSKCIAVRAENISKYYRLGIKEKMHDSMLRTILGFVSSPWTNYRKYRSLYRFDDFDPNSNGYPNEQPADVMAALRDVSFEVQEGEVLGIIGGNGAGKSTLLKILSRITAPTRGRAEFRGRVSSLLEVGTGFHPELTGRENVYLNGAVMGMTKREIDSKFDEIVDFSGVEKFLDTPVKRYSSGMTVRLAFAVAAHLEPEILLVDEVLAVGDASFQKKCLGKMGSVARQGRTILFVSHNMSAVTQLCSHTIWLKSGSVKQIGKSSEVVMAYLTEGSTGQAAWDNGKPPHSGAEVRLHSACVRLPGGNPISIADFDQSFQIEVRYEVFVPTRDLSLTCLIIDSEGRIVFETMETDRPEWKGLVRMPGLYVSRVNIDAPLLRPGRYYVTLVSFIDGIKIIAKEEGALALDVSEVGYQMNINRFGVITPLLKWETEKVDCFESSKIDRHLLESSYTCEA